MRFYQAEEWISTLLDRLPWRWIAAVLLMLLAVAFVAQLAGWVEPGVLAGRVLAWWGK